MQKKYHPDYFSNATETEKDEALHLSSQVNKAFKTFQSPDETIKYVLQLKGLLEEEEKYVLPPVFLMEVLELNEMKMDGASQKEITEKTNELQQEIYNEIETVIDNYNDATTTADELKKVKEYYYKKKYLDRLLKAD